MSRILVAAVPHTGHVRPLLTVAGTLVEHGHDVTCYFGSTFEVAARRAGADVLPMTDGLDYDENSVERVFGERPKNPVKRIAHDIAQIFVASAPPYLRDLRRFADDWRPDVLVSDTAHLPSALLAELEGIPYVVVGVIPIVAFDPVVPPFGPGLPPPDGTKGLLRVRLAHAVNARVITSTGDRHLRRIRAELGLPPTESSFFDVPTHAATAYLQGCAPEFEYPRRNPIPALEFVGPIVPRSGTEWVEPEWWPDLLAAREAGRRVVTVTQGSVAVDHDDLVHPTIRGLTGDDVFIVAAGGGADGAPAKAAGTTAAGGAAPRATVRAERFVPFDRLLPLTDVFVTNGGYGGVQQALAHGVPIVASGVSEDKKEVGRRIDFSGVGVSLLKQRPKPDEIRRAVLEVLNAPAYAERARKVQASGAAGGGLDRIVEVVESLAVTPAGAAAP